MGERERRERARAEEARKALARVEAESETIVGSSARRMATHARDHFGGADKNQDDRIEVWGTRIGRGLGLVFAVGLLIYLFVTYVK
ncbi:hypothetical protein GWI72_19630 [Microvirga tunisiensis]|uniref:Uncharacterized protein n=1 Tax=Pannonibacter tanglangensis TaxID=2750084 RepID=A0A7X5JAF9_9HYPH|nr:hypothetical protein [Pannonibacter sp. XCT-53]NBN80492.1 hypothetical protein [Pannonibacter sp. XCT-53]